MSAFRLSLAYYLMQHPIRLVQSFLLWLLLCHTICFLHSTPRLPNLPSNFSIVSDPDFPSPCDELCKSVLTTQSTLVPTPGKCLRLKKKGTEILPKHDGQSHREDNSCAAAHNTQVQILFYFLFVGLVWVLQTILQETGTVMAVDSATSNKNENQFWIYIHFCTSILWPLSSSSLLVILIHFSFKHD